MLKNSETNTIFTNIPLVGGLYPDRPDILWGPQRLWSAVILPSCFACWTGPTWIREECDWKIGTMWLVLFTIIRTILSGACDANGLDRPVYLSRVQCTGCHKVSLFGDAHENLLLFFYIMFFGHVILMRQALVNSRTMVPSSLTVVNSQFLNSGQ